MDTVEDFVKNLVDISLMDDGVNYGHYPFSGIIVKQDNNIDLLSV